MRSVATSDTTAVPPELKEHTNYDNIVGIVKVWGGEIGNIRRHSSKCLVSSG